MLSLRLISTRPCFNIVPRSLLHTTSITRAATSRAQLKKNLIKESGLKRPASAFILFTQTERSNVKDEYPDLTPIQISTKLGAKWSSLSKQEKQPFVNQYNENVKNYKTILSQLENRLPPKRPGNAYIIYVNEMLPILKEQYPDWQHTEIVKKIGADWKNLSDHEKVHYEQLYRKNLTEWKRQTGNV
ncbi:ARS-binding factor 2, mitochondrial [Monosporozyma unispora]